jgi:hypothetical protein
MGASKKAATPSVRSGPSNATLDEMIHEALVDAYGESEQTVGFYTMLEEHLRTPFKTEMLGVEVTVERIEMTDDERIVAACSRGRSRHRVSILDLPLPSPPPEGAEWILAFRRWVHGRR